MDGLTSGSRPRPQTVVTRLILMRHGQSVWNRDNLFTGATEVDLSDEGIAQSHRMAALLKEDGIVPEWCCTSLLMRAIQPGGAATWSPGSA